MYYWTDLVGLVYQEWFSFHCTLPNPSSYLSPLWFTPRRGHTSNGALLFYRFKTLCWMKRILLGRTIRSDIHIEKPSSHSADHWSALAPCLLNGISKCQWCCFNIYLFAIYKRNTPQCCELVSQAIPKKVSGWCAYHIVIGVANRLCFIHASSTFCTKLRISTCWKVFVFLSFTHLMLDRVSK